MKTLGTSLCHPPRNSLLQSMELKELSSTSMLDPLSLGTMNGTPAAQNSPVGMAKTAKPTTLLIVRVLPLPTGEMWEMTKLLFTIMEPTVCSTMEKKRKMKAIKGPQIKVRNKRIIKTKEETITTKIPMVLL